MPKFIYYKPNLYGEYDFPKAFRAESKAYIKAELRVNFHSDYILIDKVKIPVYPGAIGDIYTPEEFWEMIH